MLITYHGHSEFYLEGADGFALLTDPYDGHVGYPMLRCRADAVTVSHGHGDHNYVQKAYGAPAIIDGAGEWRIAPEVTVTAIPSVHDDANGEKRGKNLLMKIEMEGLALAHLGDQGIRLTPEQVKALGRIDILMLPVGGFFTVDAKTAREIVAQVNPRVVIPMHYKTSVNADWPISDETEFLRLMGAEGVSPLPLLRVTKGDLSEQPALALLDWRKA
ncbi:MAG: MBL fold metallo-hydrolase [Clostridia bacterium]|nr:MBL fold metallo-hydrolase [Clostridia bacterium]